MFISLALIGILGGLITGISPCILPVLPVIFLSGGAQSARAGAAQPDAPKPVSRWRPYQVILGLVVSFSLFTLVGSFLLALAHLPQDVLRWAGIVVLILIGVGLIVPAFQHIIEKPFSWIPQRNVGTDRGGFVLGFALGAVYVPCAGPVLAAITVAGSTGKIGMDTIVLTLSFAIGAALPLLIFALAGRRVAERVKTFRKRQKLIRTVGGVTMIALSIALIFNLPQYLQRIIPDYTSALNDGLGSSSQVDKTLNLGGLVNDQNKELSKCRNDATTLQSCGTAPDIQGISAWFNTQNDAPITLAQERGKVVLLDFWAYSCINCQRSIPHVVAWNAEYAKYGLRVIGIHSPEYAFEKVESNVRDGAKGFGITYPVALDNDLSTWTNYRNRYWPAHYLIDPSGTVRNIQFGEGNYANTEQLIRQLLQEKNPGVKLPPASEIADETPVTGSTTPETYLSAGKVQNYGGAGSYTADTKTFSFPASQKKNTFALDGDWTVDFQNATPAGDSGRIRLEYTATQEVRMVLGGSGTIRYSVDGRPMKQLTVSGTPDSYQLLKLTGSRSGTIEVTVPKGVEAYSFTFG